MSSFTLPPCTGPGETETYRHIIPCEVRALRVKLAQRSTITVEKIRHGMSRADAESGDPPEDRIAECLLQSEKLTTELNTRESTDVLVLMRKNGRDVLIDDGFELTEILDWHDDDVASVYHLALQLDRDGKNHSFAREHTHVAICRPSEAGRTVSGNAYAWL